MIEGSDNVIDGSDEGRRRRRVGVLVGAGLFGCVLVLPWFVTGTGSHLSAMRAAAASEHGTVWVNNVGDEVDPGNDPHLACSNIQLVGSFLAAASGAYTVVGQPPNGTGSDVAASGSWHYSMTTGGDQVIAVIDVSSLVDAAIANGDVAQAQQGFHFKLDLTNVAPNQKHKVFWVDCRATTTTSTTTSGPTPTPTPTETPTPTPTPTPTEAPTPTPTPTAGVSGTETSSSTSSGTEEASSTSTTVSGGVSGLSTSAASGGPTTGGVAGLSTSGGAAAVAAPPTGAGGLDAGLAAVLVAGGVAVLGVARRRQ